MLFYFSDAKKRTISQNDKIILKKNKQLLFNINH